ncbi:class I SAM-dependent methyltransferase [Fodinibius sp.]|uniref:class I SAM-dependent methyltransferase n=1 Tax=Fodinibius sp. TaxID=1872440 RepID=UPI00356B42DF
MEKTIMRTWFIAALVLIMGTTMACGQEKEDVTWLIDVLELSEGSVVADIGAGDGSISLALAEHVGSGGHVYSTELGADSVEYLREMVESAPVSNVTVLEGHPTQTNLPEGCCDALFLRRVYHHFKDPAAMNESMRQALKPGGRLAVIDFAPRGDEGGDPAERATGNHHGVTAETVTRELREAGFTVISSEQRSGRDVYVVVRKPNSKNR